MQNGACRTVSAVLYHNKVNSCILYLLALKVKIAEAIQPRVSGSNISFIVLALITPYHNDKVPRSVQKPLESRYWSAVTQNIRIAAEINRTKDWNEAHDTAVWLVAPSK